MKQTESEIKFQAVFFLGFVLYFNRTCKLILGQNPENSWPFTPVKVSGGQQDRGVFRQSQGEDGGRVE